MLNFLLLLGWIGTAETNDLSLLDCSPFSNNLHKDIFFYISPENLHLPCVNEWELSRTANISYKLIVSPIEQDSPFIKLFHNQTKTSRDYVHWLIHINNNCLVDKLRLSVPTAQFSEINNQFLLMSFMPSQLSFEIADLATRSCSKVDISFRHSWIKVKNDQKFSVTYTDLHLHDPSKDAFVGSLNEPEGEFMNLLEQLSGATEMTLGDGSKYTINTRYTYNSENAIAADWISLHLLRSNLDDVYKQEFLMPNESPTVNVIGVKLGKTKPDEIVVVGAHFDSISQSSNTKAPGAIDNGSGTVGMMLIAAALVNMDIDRTIHLIAFGGEEQGLHGSSHYVDEAKKQGWNIVAALTMDMTAYSNKYFGVTIEGTRDSKIQELMKIMENNMAEYASDLQVRTTTNSWGSDHVPFQKAGYAAFLAIEMDDVDYPAYHRTNDVSTYANEAQAMGILKGLAGTLYDVAQG